MATYRVRLVVNGETVRANVEPQETLLRFLRNRLGLTEVKSGCEQGDCGTCAVILEGKAVNSCLTLAVQADGKQVLTLKGIEKQEIGKLLQESFVAHGAVQCGFCTPGMIVSAANFLEKYPNPSRNEIRKAISGNLCRCTGYKKIVDAIADVASRVSKNQ
ncbi:MAG: (2Fe-2S)-binding protein [Chloroflexi bacterium]|nr:(2Fe-2S)-binding protein [Chloroflexota bacterium]